MEEKTAIILIICYTITLRISNNSNSFLEKWNISQLQIIHAFPELFTFNNKHSQVTFMTNSQNLRSIFGGGTMLSYKYKCLISHHMGICKNPFPRYNKSYGIIIMNLYETGTIPLRLEKKKKKKVRC